MAKYLIQIPANYRARVGGNSSVSVDASSPHKAKTQVVQAGIPAALIGTPTEITGNITSLLHNSIYLFISDSAFGKSGMLHGIFVLSRFI